MSQYKTCTKCSQTKPLNEFYKNKSYKDGLTYYCKICIIASSKKWYQANPEKVAATVKAYRDANPDKLAANLRAYREANRERSAIKSQEWREANPDHAKAYREANRRKFAAYSKVYREANPDKIAAYLEANSEKVAAQNKAWRAANPDKLTLKWQLRRARKLESGVFIVKAREIARLYASPCAYCGAQSKHIDHVIPVSRGGTHSIGNLTGACAPCNMSKGAKFITEWKRDK